MAVNLIEDKRVVYHDQDGDTLEITAGSLHDLFFNSTVSAGSPKEQSAFIVIHPDAVETLRDCLTRWLETGKFTEQETNDLASENES